ncbi:hypothetical protein [Planotetraspora sp. GP83]|uniref:hypothetical protein n=1 Tax=Planotetraspora sp. GP83 TaxID=3156264 RepID=UPI003513BD8E
MKIVAFGTAPVGIVAIGVNATGVIAIGPVATGVIAVGQLARGVIALGQLAVGIVVVGQLAVGVVWACGQLVIGATAGPNQFAVGLFGRLYMSRLFDPYGGQILRNSGIKPWRAAVGTLGVAGLLVLWWYAVGLQLSDALGPN